MSSGWRSQLAALGLGFFAMTPVWWEGLQDWQAAQALQAQVHLLQQELADVQAQSSREMTPPIAPPAEVAQLLRALLAQGWEVSQLGVLGHETGSAAPTGFQIQPLQLTLRGRWAHWLKWLAALPEQAPASTLTSLDLQSTLDEGLQAQLTLQWVHAVDEPTWHLADAHAQVASQTDPFNAQHWRHAQRRIWSGSADASQPSEGVDPTHIQTLAQHAIAHLQYVGHLQGGRRTWALLRVQEPGSPSVVRTASVGARLGLEGAHLHAIEPQRLVLEGWVRDATGEWQTRQTVMPLTVQVSR